MKKRAKKTAAKAIHAFGVFLMILQIFAMPLSYGVMLSPARAMAAADEDTAVNEAPAPPAETASAVQTEEETATEPATTETSTTPDSTEPATLVPAETTAPVLPETSLETPAVTPSDDTVPTATVEPITPASAPAEEASSEITTPEAVPTPAPEANGDLNTYVAPNVEADSVDIGSIDPENVEQTAALATDKADYAPTDTAIITGTGFIAGEKYTLKITSSDTPPTTTEVEITADENGQFVYAYQLDGTFRPNYTVVASTPSGEELAETSFTDKVNTTTMLDPIDSLTAGQTNVAFSG